MIDIKRLKRQNLRFKFMLIMSYILFTFLIFLAIYFVYSRILLDQNIKNFKQDASTQGKIEADFLQKVYLQGYDTLETLDASKEFEEFLQTKDTKKVKSLFLSLIKEHKTFMQLRFLDQNGHEIIRYDRNFIGTNVFESGILQDKSHRKYFKEARDRRIIYFSPLDLNMEQKKIQKPLKQVLRISFPVMREDKFKGALVVNIFICSFLEHLSLASGFDIYLVDRDGFFITAPQKSLRWSRFFSKINITSQLDIPLEQLSQKAHFYPEKTAYIQPLGIDSTNSPYLIYMQSKKRQEQVQNDMLRSGIYAFLFAFVLAFPFSYIIALPISSVFKSLQKKSEYLTLVANNLEKKISKEIEKSRQKDRLLENNAKLVALGEMIANIAHQWRHPLTRLSLIIQNLSRLDLQSRKSWPIYESYIKNSLDQISFMSDTIEDFRNFYKEDNKKTYFKPAKAVEDAMKIIGGAIRHDGISMNICLQSSCEIFGYQNRFAQVILNLLHNSKEALKNEENQQIRVYITSDDKFCKVSVVDNGCGIKKEHLEKIFDSKFSTKKDGSGIGLYLSRLIIKENFNGKIKAQNLKKGAKFTIIIPLKF